MRRAATVAARDKAGRQRAATSGWWSTFWLNHMPARYPARLTGVNAAV